MNKCECGCGRVCEKKFLRGHSGRGKPRKEEHKVKMREGWTEELREQQRLINKGKTLDQEHRSKIGKGNLGKVRTDEVKSRISKSLKGRYVGDKNPFWKGGTSRASKNGYYSPEYLDWRKKVFERDNYTCQHCSVRGGKYLTAHHIKSFAKFPELRFDLNNGIALCEECHCKVDSYRARFKSKQH